MVSVLSKIFNVVFPETCVVCGSIVHDGHICSNCFSALSFITNPMCTVCGFPFKFYEKNSDNKNYVCVNCLKQKPFFDKSISVLRYNDAAKQIILPFKHGDKTFLNDFIADLMFKFGKDVINKADFIVPVPISFIRLLKRKYNQSALIASAICAKSGKAYLGALKRIKFTKSQGHLPEKERIANVKNCFSLNKNFLNKIKDKNILLIDDVFTTGATVNECAKVLKQNGVNKVFVLTLCKVC